LLIENNFIHFLGSDVHKTGHIYQNMDKMKKELRKIISEEKLQELTYKNAKKVIKNEELEIDIPYKIKQNFLQKIFNK